jgi:hypothetical protein
MRRRWWARPTRWRALWSCSGHRWPHTGEIQLRDEGNYAGPTINRTARLRDLGHGGQTVVSGTTELLVADRLPDGVWLGCRGLGRGGRGHRGRRRVERGCRGQRLPRVGFRGYGRRRCCDGARRDRGGLAAPRCPAGDLVAARRVADEAVATATGWYLTAALIARARVAIAQGELDLAERDAHDALVIAVNIQACFSNSDILECLATLAGDRGTHREAARLLGAACAIRQRIGEVRLKVWDAGYQASVAALRDALGEKDFDSTWAEGATLSTEERSPTPSAAAANANGRPAVGHRSPPRSVTSCDSSARDWPTATSPQGFSSHRAPCKPTSPTSTPNWA